MGEEKRGEEKEGKGEGEEEEERGKVRGRGREGGVINRWKGGRAGW